MSTMSADEYMRVYTEKYEGTYTAKEVELNKKLYEECSKDELDCDAIERLLEQGADPLGATEVSGWGLLEHVYGEIVLDSQYDDTNLPKITEIFLNHGMDIEKPRIPYDDSNSIHPMWDLAFLTDENAISVLKMFLDRGLSASATSEMWQHITFDLIYVDRDNPNDGKDGTENCVWAVRYMLFCASYDHIIDNDESLREIIGLKYNNYDLHKFRNWNDYRYEFDTKRCYSFLEFDKSIVRVFEKESNKEIWKFGIGFEEEDF